MQNDEINRPQIQNSGSAGLLIGLLTGGLVGAVTMLLMAPQSGEQTRQQIQEKSIELRDHASYMLEEAVGQARLDGSKVRVKAEKILHDGQTLLAEQLKNVSEAVKTREKTIQIS